LEPFAGHSVNLPKAKPKVQIFDHELSWPLDLDGHSVKPLKVKPKVQTQKEHPTLFFVQNNLSKSSGQDLVNDWIFYEKKPTTSRPQFGFPILSDPNFLRESGDAFFKKQSFKFATTFGLWP
jgi:hypothetical protein